MEADVDLATVVKVNQKCEPIAALIVERINACQARQSCPKPREADERAEYARNVCGMLMQRERADHLTGRIAFELPPWPQYA